MPAPVTWVASVTSGAGGASKAFQHADGRRAREIADVLGFTPYPGSLNLLLSRPFDWEAPHIRAPIFDVVERGKGLDVEWRPRPGRFYPLVLSEYHGAGKFDPPWTLDVWAFRFEGERYPPHFVELVAPVRLRDVIRTDRVTLWLR